MNDKTRAQMLALSLLGMLSMFAGRSKLALTVIEILQEAVLTRWDDLYPEKRMMRAKATVADPFQALDDCCRKVSKK